MKKIIPARVIERCCNCSWFCSRTPGCGHFNHKEGVYDGPRKYEKTFDWSQYNTTIHPDCPLEDAKEEDK